MSAYNKSYNLLLPLIVVMLLTGLLIFAMQTHNRSETPVDSAKLEEVSDPCVRSQLHNWFSSNSSRPISVSRFDHYLSKCTPEAKQKEAFSKSQIAAQREAMKRSQP